MTLAKSSKQLGLWMCTALVVGNMIGSGIFLLPSSLAVYGGISIVGWLFTTFGALMTALVFMRLSRNSPAQGGPYAFTRDAFGPLAGFTVAWSYWVSIWCANAAISVAMVSYLSSFFPILEAKPYLGVAVALSAVWFLTYVNCRGVTEAGKVQLITTVIKVIPLLAIGLAVIFYFEASAFEPLNKSDSTNYTAVTACAALTLWAFLGFESATIPADNIESPSTVIPRATFIGFVVAAVIYIASTTTILSVMPHTDLATSGAPFADAASIMWGPWAGKLIAIIAIISCFGALNGWILLQGQLPMAVAEDGDFPKLFKGDEKTGVPVKGLIISSILVSLLAISNYAGGLVKLFTFSILLATLAVLIPYLFTVLAELKAIWQRKKLMQEWFSWQTALLALVYTIWAISGIGREAILVGIGLMAAGLPVYFWMQNKK